MIKNLLERQAAIQAQVDKYAPTRHVFEEFLRAGQQEDAGFLWWISPGSSDSRYSWKREEFLTTPEGQKIVVKTLTDPKAFWLGDRADDVSTAPINVEVSLADNPALVEELVLPPIWAILDQDSHFSDIDLGKLGEDLEDIVPLVRACLLEFNPLTNESKEFS